LSSNFPFHPTRPDFCRRKSGQWSWSRPKQPWRQTPETSRPFAFQVLKGGHPSGRGLLLGQALRLVAEDPNPPDRLMLDHLLVERMALEESAALQNKGSFPARDFCWTGVRELISPEGMTRHLLLLALTLVSSNCALNDTAKLKASKTCVIAMELKDEADFHSLGFTAFGNRHDRSKVPGLKAMAEQVLREELGRYYQVKAVVPVPDLGSVGISRRKAAYDSAMADSRARHRADLEFHAYGHEYHPYGIPRHLTSDGFGYYAGGLPGSMVVAYTGLVVTDGITGGAVASSFGENDFGILPDGDTFAKERYRNPSSAPVRLSGSWSGGGWAAMTPEQRGQLMRAFRDLYRDKVRNQLWKMKLR
jgi:hypothetical protein